MAKLLTRTKLKGKPAAPKQPKALTIEEAREKYELGTEERAFAELRELSSFKDKARLLTNAKNRQQTQAGKALKQMILDELIDYGDEIQIDDQAFSYDYARSESIDKRALYNMVVSGEVKLDDFLKCIYVQKDMANKVIGTHVIAPLCKEEIGKKADVRIRDLDKPVAKPAIVRKPPPKPAKRLQRDTDRAPTVANVSTGRLGLRRRLNVRAR